jgi:hypothetical protein
MAQNTSQFAVYLLKPVVHHKQLLLHIFFSHLGIPLADFVRSLLIANTISGLREPACASQGAKVSPLVMHKQLSEPACDAQMAKGSLGKLITSGFSEHTANHAVFSVMYIKTLSSNIRITTE